MINLGLSKIIVASLFLLAVVFIVKEDLSQQHQKQQQTQLIPMVSQNSAYSRNETKIQNEKDNTLTSEPQTLNSRLTLDQIKEKVHLSIKSKKSRILYDENSTKMPITVTLSVDDLGAKQNSNIDLVCVLDTSGSMYGEKLKLLKETFTFLFKLLSEKDRLSIVSFNSNADEITPLLYMTDENKKYTQKMINGLTAGGGTNIYSGFAAALSVFRSRKEKNEVENIFLLTDGQDSNSNIVDLLDNFRSTDQINVNTFGFGNDHEAKILGEIAVRNGGNFYFIEEISKIDEAFSDSLAEIQSFFASNIEFEISPINSGQIKDVKITNGYGPVDFWKKTSKGKYLARLDSIVYGKSRNLVLEIEIPKLRNLNYLEEPIEIILSSVTLKVLTNKGYEKLTKVAKLSITVSKKTESTDDLDVIFNTSRFEYANALKSSQTYSEKGEYEKSQEVLTNVKESLKMHKDKRIENLSKDIESSIQENNSVNYRHGGWKKTIQRLINVENESSTVNSNVDFKNTKQIEYHNALVAYKMEKE